MDEQTVRRIIRDEVQNGSAGVLLRQLQGMVRQGEGDPNGVVDAPYGVIYEDRANGDVYRKASASGTLTGWTKNFP